MVLLEVAETQFVYRRPSRICNRRQQRLPAVQVACLDVGLQLPSEGCQVPSSNHGGGGLQADDSIQCRRLVLALHRRGQTMLALFSQCGIVTGKFMGDAWALQLFRQFVKDGRIDRLSETAVPGDRGLVRRRQRGDEIGRSSARAGV